jgi:hypothetical protein
VDRDTELVMVGAALLAGQRLEFALYGIAAHLRPEILAQHDRLRGLTAENFLRGDLDDHRATLGQLVRAVGDRLLIGSPELNQFVQDRNILVHRYWRLTRSNIRSGEKLEDPADFLMSFGKRCDCWIEILQGLMYLMMGEAASREGRDFSLNGGQEKAVEAYYVEVQRLCGEK